MDMIIVDLVLAAVRNVGPYIDLLLAFAKKSNFDV